MNLIKIKKNVCKKLFDKDDEPVSGIRTYLASEKSLGKLWGTKEEDEIWGRKLIRASKK